MRQRIKECVRERLGASVNISKGIEMSKLTPVDSVSERNEKFESAPPQLKEIGDRIAYLRNKAGLTQAELAKLIGVNQSNIARWEMNAQAPRQMAAGNLATALGTTTDWLIKGGELESSNTRKIVGLVGAGGSVSPCDDDNDLGYIDPPFLTPKDSVAVEVRGDSMVPLMEEGDLVLYRMDAPFILQDCINRRCVVQTEEGSVYVKRLRFAQMEGCFDLESMNAPTLKNQRIVWAGPVLGIVYR